MTALYVIISIILLVVLLLLARLRFSLAYDGEIRLRISYLCIRFSLYPRKKRKPKKTSKNKKKRLNPAKKHTPPNRGTGATAKKKKPLRLKDIRFLLRLFREVLSHVLAKASRHVRIRIKHLRLSIGGADDAARAAIEYGVVSQSVSYFLEFMRNTGFLKPPKARAVNVGVNFLEEEHELALRIDVTCPLLFLIPLALSSLTKALTAKNRWSRYRARTAAQAQDKNQQAKEKDNG